MDVPALTNAMFVRVEKASGRVQVGEIDVFGIERSEVERPYVNVADAELPGVVAFASSAENENFVASQMIDGKIAGFNGALTVEGENEFLQLDLGAGYALSEIVIDQRNGKFARMNEVEVVLYDVNGNEVHRFEPITGAESGQHIKLQVPAHLNVMTVRMEKETGYVQAGEIYVYGDLSSRVERPGVNLTDALASDLIATASSAYKDSNAASYAIDGITDGTNGALTRKGNDEFIQLDFGAGYDLTKIVIDQLDFGYPRMNDAEVVLFDAQGDEVYRTDPISGAENGNDIVIDVPAFVNVATIQVQKDQGFVQVGEFDVYGDLSSRVALDFDGSF